MATFSSWIIQVYSSLTFSWLNELFIKASEKPLQIGDVPPVVKHCSSSLNGERMGRYWSPKHKGLYKDASNITGGIIFALVQSYSREYLYLGILLAAIVVVTFSGPILLKLLTECAEIDSPFWLIGLYIILLLLFKLISTMLLTQYIFYTGRLTVSISSGLKCCLFQKTLRLSTHSRSQFTAGNISNYYTVDIERIVNAIIASHKIWALPLQIAIAMILLFEQVSYASFAGLCSIGFVLVVNHFLSRIQKKANDQTMESKDMRMKVTGEVFQSILIVKFNSWEDNFMHNILQIREEELKHIWTTLYIAALSICLLWMAPCVVSVSTITVYVKYLHEDVKASNIFTALALFRMLQDPLKDLPNAITQLYQALSSIERLQNYFTSEEKDFLYLSSSPQVDCTDYHHPGTIAIPSGYFVWDQRILEMESFTDLKTGKMSIIRDRLITFFNQIPHLGSNSSYSPVADSSTHGGGTQQTLGDHKVELTETKPQQFSDTELSSILLNKGNEDDSTNQTGISVHLPNNQQQGFVLKLNQLLIPSGSLLIISGPVGSGKSSFCSALLSEMYSYSQAGMSSTEDSTNLQSMLTTSDSISYASQQAWIQNMSIRDNILFGLPFNKRLYELVIEACCLLPDFEMLPGYDLTHIGEKGLNLSGGQKARISLARAFYADTDIVILDDVFAALDADSGKKVFEQGILRLLKGKTCICVTHNVDIIRHPGADISVVMQEGEFTVIQDISHQKSDERIRQKIQGQPRSSILNSDLTVSGKYLYPQQLRHSTNPILVPPDDAKSATSVAATNAAMMPTAEDQAEGQIDKKVYWSYLSAMGGLRTICFLLVVQSCWQAMSISSDFYLSSWSRENVVEQQKNLNRNIMMYAALSLGSGCIVLIRTMTISLTGFSAAKILFVKMLKSLLHAPNGWFDRNPSGRILNRMGDDQAKVDTVLPFAVGSLFATGFSVGGDLLGAVIISRGILIMAIIPISFFYIRIAKQYLTASREIQRIAAVSQSPVLTYMSECNEGVYTIRAFGREAVERCVIKNEELIDENSKMGYLATAASAWFVFRIQLVSIMILLFITTIAFSVRYVMPGKLSAGLIGLSISYGLSISNGLQSLVMMVSWFENVMVCPERIFQYVNLDEEGTEKQKLLYRDSESKDRDVMNNSSDSAASNVGSKFNERDLNISFVEKWPNAGNIEFRNVMFRYQPGGALVIRNISFSICGGEKIGIVGRTGSGKSSLSMCLFRIAELSGGSILIDGIDISNVALKVLRSAIEIVPQSPVLFKGPVRNYLDPLSEFSDAQIWEALLKCKMTHSLSQLYRSNERLKQETPLPSPSSGNEVDDEISCHLATEISENGSNLSVGERQMLVLSRAVLRGANILLMDEATSSVDAETDREIQGILRSEFAAATVLTIAHRIDTILHCDRILVLSDGEIAEFDSPDALLGNQSSMFYNLAKKAGVVV